MKGLVQVKTGLVRKFPFASSSSPWDWKARPRLLRKTLWRKQDKLVAQQDTFIFRPKIITQPWDDKLMNDLSLVLFHPIHLQRNELRITLSFLFSSCPAPPSTPIHELASKLQEEFWWKQGKLLRVLEEWKHKHPTVSAGTKTLSFPRVSLAQGRFLSSSVSGRILTTKPQCPMGEAAGHGKHPRCFSFYPCTCE